MNIIDFIPTGRANAISRKRLSDLCGLPDRPMRNAIEIARKDYAILNIDGSGYFRPAPDEMCLVSRWLRQERSREKSVKQSTLGAEKFVAGSTECKGVIAVSGYYRRKNAETQVDGQIRL